MQKDAEKSIKNGPAQKSVLREIFSSKFALLYFLIGMVIFFSLMTEKFMTIGNISNMLIVQVTIGSMALGAICILIIGEFDLSLGYLIGFLMMLGAVLAQTGLNAVIIVLIMIAVGAVVGFVNGVLTVLCNISSFIATLSVGILFSGVTLGISGGQTISGKLPQLIWDLGQAKLFNIGYSVWILLLMAIIMAFVLQFTRFGRNLYAIGGSEKIAYLSGIKTKKVRIMAFVLAGLFTGIAAIFQLGQAGAAFPAFGSELLMPAYAVVFLGVTTYKQGTYNVPGLVLAVLVLGVGVNGLNMMGAQFWVESVFNGVVLLLAVLVALKQTRNIKVF